MDSKRLWLTLMVGVVMSLAWLSGASLTPLTDDAAAHAPFTCTHTERGHWSWGRYHEVRFQRHWWMGGRHYHRYHYYVWTLGTSWEFKKRLTYDCTGSR